MRFTLALVSTFFLASAALAGRLGHQHRSPFNEDRRDSASTENSPVAGAFILNQRHFLNFASVQFHVPEIHSNGQILIVVSADVGLNKDYGEMAALECSMDNGKASYQAYGRVFGQVHNFTDLQIDAGNLVELSVTKDSSTSGIVTINNISRQRKIKQPLNSSAEFKFGNVAWFLTAVSEHLPMFDQIEMKGKAQSANGEWLTPTHGSKIEIVEKGKTLTQTTIEEDCIVIKHQ